ncbi:MAG: hypothetical protein KDK63_00030 [Chlamydiia bacterium]|nr:hypothetical protein [Chlamydiia bacterium]
MAGSTTFVPGLRAALNYFDRENSLGVLGTASFLGKQLVPIAGGNLKTFPVNLDKMTGFVCNAGDVVLQLPAITQTIHDKGRRFWQGVRVLGGYNNLENLRIEENGDVPRHDNPYFGATYLTVSSLLGGLFKTAACAVVLYEASKRVGILNKMANAELAAIGSGFGIAGQLVNIVDAGRALIDLEKEKDLQQYTTKIQSQNKEEEVSNGDKTLHNECSRGARWLDIALSIVMIGVGAVEIAHTLHHAERAGLFGRVTHFACRHGGMLYGGLYTTATIMSFFSYYKYGATIQELEHRNEKRKLSRLEYLKDLPGKQEFFGLGMGFALAAKDYKIKEIGSFALEPIGDLLKQADQFTSAMSLSKSIQDIGKKAREGNWDLKYFVKMFKAAVKCSAVFFGVVQFAGLFIAPLSPYSDWIGNAKKICSVYSAIIGLGDAYALISVEHEESKAEKRSVNNERLFEATVIGARSFTGIWCQGIGGIAAASFGPEAFARAGLAMPKEWTYYGSLILTSTLAITKNVIYPPAA